MESIDKLVEQLASDDQIEVYRAKRELSDLLAQAGAPGQDAQRAEVAAALVTSLNATKKGKDRRGKEITVPKLSPAVRRQLARYLGLVAAEPEIPGIKTALQDLEVREAARWCLDRMTCAAATAALAEVAVDSVGNELRCGAIGALGRRQGQVALDALKTCVKDADADVRLAAAEALANHPDASLDALIAGAGSHGRARCRATKARIRLAETLARSGNKDGAKRVYQAVLAAQPAEAQKKAAKMGIEKLD